MSYDKAQENRVAKALGQCATGIKRTGNGQWGFALANGKLLDVSARLLDDWLLLDAMMNEQNAHGVNRWELLRLNATLPGLSKFVLVNAQSYLSCSTNFRRPSDFSLPLTQKPEGFRQIEVCRTNVHLRADIPLPDLDEGEAGCGTESDLLTARLLETCAALKSAFRAFGGARSVGELRCGPPTVEERGPQQIDQLRLLCGDAGWPFIERSEGRLMIDLDVRSCFYQAALEHREAGTEIVVEIANSEALGETSRQALGLLLLRTGALVRLARPSIVQNEGQVSVRFEVRLNAKPTATELAHAFSSLSVACAMSGREARALLDEVIASDYLGILGAQPLAPAAGAGYQKDNGEERAARLHSRI